MSLIKTQFTEVEKHKRMKPLKGDNWSGGMRLMLGGVESIEEVLAQTQFSGDWFFRDVRFQIFKKPRKFKLKFYLLSDDNKVLHSCADFTTAANDVALTANICELGNNLIAESGLPINPENSYVVVRA